MRNDQSVFGYSFNRYRGPVIVNDAYNHWHLGAPDIKFTMELVNPRNFSLANAPSGDYPSSAFLQASVQCPPGKY